MVARNFLFVSGATAFGIAYFLYTVTITDDLKNSLNSINKEEKKKHKDRRQSFELLRDFIQLHSIARQLSKSLSV